MNRRIAQIGFVIVLLLQSCGDEHVFTPDVDKASQTNPKIKFIHAASDTAGLNLFLDDVKLTGGTFSTITTFGSVNLGKVNIGTVTFQNAFPVTNYTTSVNSSGTFSVIFPESYTVTVTYPTKTLSTLTSPALEDETFYTVAYVGIYPTHEIVVYEDDLSTTPMDGNVYIRFANFIDNSADGLALRATPPATAADPTPAAVTFFPNVAYKGMSNFIALPRGGTYTNVQILNANTLAVIATLAAANSAFANQKVYTIFGRGRIGGAGTAAPGVSRAINR